MRWTLPSRRALVEQETIAVAAGNEVVRLAQARDALADEVLRLRRQAAVWASVAGDLDRFAADLAHLKEQLADQREVDGRLVAALRYIEGLVADDSVGDQACRQQIREACYSMHFVRPAVTA